VPDIVGIPKLGLSDFGELVSWEVSVGEAVEAGDLLAIIESDKASAEVEAPVDGVLLAVYVEPGTEIEIEPGRPIAVIGEQGEEPPPASAVSAADTTTAGPGEDTDDSSTEAPAAGGGADAASTGLSDVAAPDADAGAPKVSPRARRAAAQADGRVDFAAIRGTGPEGSIVEADVLTHLDETRGGADSAETGVPDRAVRATPSARRLARESGIDLDSVWSATGGAGTITTTEVRSRIEGGRSDGTAATPATQSGSDLTVTETRTLSGTRRTIADRLSASAREKPHVMGTREISIEHLRRVQERLADAHGVDASISDLVFYAVGRTLRDMPAFNAHFVDGEHRLFEEVNVGYAVDGPSGLVVPVVENVASRPFADVAADRSALVERVLDGEHSPADLSGGTFTVTNVGAFDMDVSYSIINPPQVAILAMGRVKERAVERDGDIALEEVVTFSLTIDHRVLDGADSGRFLDELADNLEFPGRVFEV
jgi:pyruvate dehydrogenase E2 component (dihydrolipoamide acetyltransferase)